MNKAPPFLIIADRGRLIAYSLEKTVRGPAPRVVESIDFVEAHTRLGEQLTDKAGAFPAGHGQATAAAERMTLETELDLRSFRVVADWITKLLEKHQPETWGFAAPSEINGAILDELRPELRQRLEKNVCRDLTKIPASELLAHFEPGAKAAG